MFRSRFLFVVLPLLWAQFAHGESSLPEPDPHYSGTVGRTFLESDPPVFPQSKSAPENAPNIVIVMLDDVGYGQFSAFGGAVPAPAMEKLAATGVRYNRFHTVGICSPTRASLLTGRNSHNVGFGHVGEMATGYDGYVGSIPRDSATIAEILRQNGYATAMIGKNHNTPAWEAGPAGPFNHWPTGMGFDYFYGFNAWGTSQWQPLLFENTRPVEPSRNKDYHLTVDIADHAISWMHNIKSTNPDKPFFLYVATGAMHAPHHAPKEWIDRFKGQFEMGWDRYREMAFERQKKLGVIPANTQLTPRPQGIPAWSSFNAEQRAALSRQMEVFAAFGAHTDYQIGRIFDAVKSLPDADNTMIIYIVGDNGASAEGGNDGEVNELSAANGLRGAIKFDKEVLSELGGARYNNNYSRGWAWAMSTPFQYYKQVVSHLGATRNPLIVSWPARIKANAVVRSQFTDVNDITPTILDAIGVEAPRSVNGIAQKPMDGVSFLETLSDSAAPEKHKKQYFEVFGNRAIYANGWFASAPLATDTSQSNRAGLDPDKVKWELYHLDNDYSQANDLAARNPDKLREMQELWWAEAGQNHVLPLDWRAAERLVSVVRPNPTRGRSQFTYYPPIAGIPEAIAPSTHNRSWRLTAKGDFDANSEGVIATQGGMIGGWALYVLEGKLVFDYNYNEIWYRQIVSGSAIPAGTTELEMRFVYDGKSTADRGAGGLVTMIADGHSIGDGRLEKTLSGVYSVSEGLDIGADYGSPVSDNYPFPFPFKGKLDSVTIELQ